MGPLCPSEFSLKLGIGIENIYRRDFFRVVLCSHSEDIEFPIKTSLASYYQVSLISLLPIHNSTELWIICKERFRLLQSTVMKIIAVQSKNLPQMY